MKPPTSIDVHHLPTFEELLEESAAASLDEDEELQKVAEKAVTQLVKSALGEEMGRFG